MGAKTLKVYFLGSFFSSLFSHAESNGMKEGFSP